MWQAWLGRGLIAVNAIVLAIGAFLGVEMSWWQPVMVAATGIINVIIGLFPPTAVAVAVDAAKTAAKR